MTPADEQRFIQLWQQGCTSAEIAQALGVPLGTVSSRTHSLQQ
jgi:DNA-directed RNA polymerase specialized sigma24 family protein